MLLLFQHQKWKATLGNTILFNYLICLLFSTDIRLYFCLFKLFYLFALIKVGINSFFSMTIAYLGKRFFTISMNRYLLLRKKIAYLLNRILLTFWVLSTWSTYNTITCFLIHTVFKYCICSEYYETSSKQIF